MSNKTVLSTRIRLARNLSELPFPCRLNLEGKKQVIEKIRNSTLGATFIDMKNLSHEQALSLVERHLISPEFAKNFDGKGLLLNEENPNKKISVMINEEDHIRIQVISKGLDLEKTYQAAVEIDEKLGKAANIAYSDDFGYLTQCPTNLGTGMRASVMLHLPALQKTRTIESLAQNLMKIGLTIRGLYGEGTEPSGAIYQLSNQITLGISEQAAIENLKNITLQIAAQEEGVRESLLKSSDVCDSLSRSLGLLKFCKSIDHTEATGLLSNVRFAVACGYIDCINLDDIDTLFEKIQPANIVLEAGEPLTPQQRDEKRAEIIQTFLS